MKTFIKISTFLFILCSSQLWADNDVEQGVENNQPENSLLEYWTPERLMNAKEMPYPEADPNQLQELDKDPLNLEESQQEDGAPPEEDTELNLMPLIPESMLNLEQEEISQSFFNRGISGANFSSSRLVPITADLVYPYRTVGRLFLPFLAKEILRAQLL